MQLEGLGGSPALSGAEAQPRSNLVYVFQP